MATPQANPGGAPPPPPGQYGQPPQGQDQNYPQQGYAGGPPQAPPPGQYQYPPYQQYGQQYGQPQAPPPGAPYGAPPQGYPPQGYPPQQYPQQYQQPGQYMGQPPPPQGQQPYPPPQQPLAQGQYPPQQPPQGQYMPPLQPYLAQGQPQFQQQQPAYGAGAWDRGAPPPTQQQVIPVPPSLGYIPGQKASGDASKDADNLRKAMKGFGTDEATLIAILGKPDPLRIALIRQTYTERIGRDLEKDIKSETSGDFETALVGLQAGPLGLDVRMIKKAMAGVGTNEDLLDDVLIGRSNADLKAIKVDFVQTYKKSLDSALKSDLSGKTERFFLMLTEANRPEPGTYFDQHSIDNDVREIHAATEGRQGTDEVAVFAIFLGATDAKICAISDAYERKYHRSLEKLIKDEFSGHLENVLLAMLHRAKNPITEIAARLNSILTGTIQHDRLIYWIIKLHWDVSQFEAVKKEFKKTYKAELTTRILTSLPPGHLSNLMRKML